MPLRRDRDLFEISPVHVLPQADGRNGDAVVGGVLRQAEAVAFFRNTVRQQHDVFVSGVDRQNLAVGFGQRGRDLRAAIRHDAADFALDQRPCCRRVRIGTSHMKELSKISTPTRSSGLRFSTTPMAASARQFDLLAFHRRRLIDDQHHAGALRRARRNQLRRERCAPADLRARPCDRRKRCARRRSISAPPPPCTNFFERAACRPAASHPVLMLLKTTSCVPSRSAGSVFDCTKSNLFAVSTSTMWPSVPGGSSETHCTRGRRTATAFSKRDSPRPGGLDLAAEIDRAGGVQAGADADAVLAGFERDLMRADLLAFGRQFDGGGGRARRINGEIHRESFAGEDRAGNADRFGLQLAAAPGPRARWYRSERRVAAACQAARVTAPSFSLPSVISAMRCSMPAGSEASAWRMGASRLVPRPSAPAVRASLNPASLSRRAAGECARTESRRSDCCRARCRSASAERALAREIRIA